jgi:predicted amidohydrolase
MGKPGEHDRGELVVTSNIPPEYQAFERNITVGCVNFAPVWGDKKATLAKIEANVHEAAAQGVDLLIFPEESLTGASSCQACRVEGQACDDHLALAETVPGPATEQVAGLAKELGVYVVFGLPERDPDDHDLLYNAAAVIGPEGILGTYRKIHLGSVPWVTEGITFRPGDRLPVFPTRFGPIGVQICYDFWFNPELCRILALKGARLLVNCCASFAGPAKRDYLVQTTSVRAQENLVYAASANLVGGPGREDYSAEHLDGPLPDAFAGHSVIAGPAFPRFSQVYAEAGDREELVSATLSFEKLHRWQSVFPMREWRATRQMGASRLIADEFARLAGG